MPEYTTIDGQRVEVTVAAITDWSNLHLELGVTS